MAKQKESTKSNKPKAKPLPQKKVRVRQQVKKGEHGGTQLVLLEDMVHVGKQGQLVEVKAGYARNYLIPNGFAIAPSEHNLRLLERYKVRVGLAREARMSDLKSLAEQILRTKSVSIEVNATEDGHLYGSVGPQEIARAMRGKNLLVEPEMIKLPEHLKELGYDIPVPISLGYEIETSILVNILPLATARR
ncbi:MAG: 50S ribosomal protein L9 [Gemmataceae bacterium]|nr:50S ribosomal protein L9 [Gemmataceae bacterium]